MNNKNSELFEMKLSVFKNWIIPVICMIPIVHACSEKSSAEPLSDTPDRRTSFSLHSNVLKEERTCFVSFPEGYEDPGNVDHSYPLIVLLDGQTFLKITEGIVHFMSSNRSRNYFMSASIVVAIENVDRERDFTVTKIKTKRENTMGGGRKFLKFIQTELIPYIDNHYRTDQHRTLVGHSLGGLLTINAYMDKTTIFDAFVSIDPSIWWDQEMMKNKVDSIQPGSLSKPLFIASANLGKEKMGRNLQRHEELTKMIKNRSENVAIKHLYFEGEDHRSVPLKGIYEGLRFVYKDQ